MNKFEEQILDYLEGNLSKDQKILFEAHLKEDLQFAKVIENYKKIVALEIQLAKEDHQLETSFATSLVNNLPARSWYQWRTFRPKNIYLTGTAIAGIILLISLTPANSRFARQTVLNNPQSTPQTAQLENSLVALNQTLPADLKLDQAQIHREFRSRTKIMESMRNQQRTVKQHNEYDGPSGTASARLMQAKLSGKNDVAAEIAPERILYELGKKGIQVGNVDLEMRADATTSPTSERNQMLTLTLTAKASQQNEQLILLPILNNSLLMESVVKGLKAVPLNIDRVAIVGAEGKFSFKTLSEMSLENYKAQSELSQQEMLQQLASEVLKVTKQAYTRILIVTDSDQELSQDLQKELVSFTSLCSANGITLSSLSFANSTSNDSFLEALTTQASGNFYVIDSKESLAFYLAREFELGPIVATDIEIIAAFSSSSLLGYRLLGENSWNFSSVPLRLQLSDLRAGDSRFFVFEIRQHDAIEALLEEGGNAAPWVALSLRSAEANIRSNVGSIARQIVDFPASESWIRWNTVLALGAEKLKSRENTDETRHYLQNELNSWSESSNTNYLKAAVNALFS